MAETSIEKGDVPFLAAFDLDQTHKRNSQFGAEMVNGAHRALLELFSDVVPEATACGWLNGQRMFATIPAKSNDEAAEIVERFRQTLEKTKFQHQSIDMQLIASAAVIQRADDESAQQCLERLEAALAEAKNYGRNRTFMFDHDCPKPVAPPELQIKPHTHSF